ncbi:MAG: hypothetical protein WD801_12955 [Gemmatimonadaceae bacterium]
MVRTMFLSAMLLLAASAAGAQITTYVAPPRAPLQFPQTIAVADSAREAEITTEMTNMRAWVDSAAGVDVPAIVGVDTVVYSPPVVTFTDGAVAPATASPLSALALFGIASLVMGAGLLMRRPRR